MLSDFLYGIDASTMILGTFFAIIFAVLIFLLNRTIFKENRGLSTIIAFCIALLATWGINRSNYDLSGLVFSLGISENSIYIITPVLLLFTVIIASVKKDRTTHRKSFSFGRFILILGLLVTALGISPIIYQKGFYIITGAVLIIFGLIAGFRSKKKANLDSNPYVNQRREQKAQQRLTEKQNRWARKQQEKEAKRRAGKINEIKGRREQIQTQRNLQEQQKRIQDEKWAREQQKRAEVQRQKNLQEQKKYEEQDRRRMTQEQQKELQRQQEKQVRMQKLRQRDIENLRMIYNEKYQEAIKLQNLAAKGVSGAKERYIRLQKELQNIVDKINKISGR